MKRLAAVLVPILIITALMFFAEHAIDGELDAMSRGIAAAKDDIRSGADTAQTVAELSAEWESIRDRFEYMLLCREFQDVRAALALAAECSADNAQGYLAEAGILIEHIRRKQTLNIGHIL